MIAISPAYHDHPPQRLLQNFPDTTVSLPTGRIPFREPPCPGRQVGEGVNPTLDAVPNIMQRRQIYKPSSGRPQRRRLGLLGAHGTVSGLEPPPAVKDRAAHGFRKKTRNDYIRNARAFAAFISSSAARSVKSS